MGFNANLPAHVKRGVDVNVRRHPGGGLIVLVRIWPDVFSKLGWSHGDAVGVFEGEGDDAGRLMLQRAVPPYAAHVRKLGAPGSGEAPGHLQLAVHWPAYKHPFTSRTAIHELPGGELEGALIVHMPREPGPPQPPPPPAASAKAPAVRPAEEAAAPPKTVASLVPPGRLPAYEAVPAAALTADDVVVKSDAAAPAEAVADSAAAPAAGGDLAAVREIAEITRGNTQRCVSAFLAAPRLSEQELIYVLARKGRPAGRGTVAGAIYQARAALRGTGWHIAATGGGVFQLTEGEDPEGRGFKTREVPEGAPPLPRPPAGKRAAKLAPKPSSPAPAARAPEPKPKPKPETQVKASVRRPPSVPPAVVDLAVTNAIDAMATTPPRRTRIKAPASGCQYIVVRSGKAQPCGADAEGVYCNQHRRASAGMGGEAA